MGERCAVADGMYPTETIANPGTPTVVLTTGYGANSYGAARKDGLRTSLSATVGGNADFANLFAYDALGRMTDVAQAQQSGGNAVAAKHIHFAYTATSQFDTVTRYASTGTGSQVVVGKYTYDFANRLIGRKEYNGSGVVVKNTRFVYDGNQAALQFDRADNGTVGVNDLSHRYLWGAAVDQLLADEKLAFTGGSLVSAETYWPLGDHLNTVRDLATYADAVTSIAANHHFLYDAYGTMTNRQTAAVDTVINFTGRFFDNLTKLQWNLNRWYDPAVGKWISDDPIGFEAGDANLARYVGNEPLNSVDPTGLDRWGQQRYEAKTAVAIEARAAVDRIAARIATKVEHAGDGVVDVDEDLAEIRNEASRYFEARIEINNLFANGHIKDHQWQRVASSVEFSMVTPGGVELGYAVDSSFLERLSQSGARLGEKLAARDAAYGCAIAVMEGVETAGTVASIFLSGGALYKVGKAGGKWAVAKVIAKTAGRSAVQEGVAYGLVQAGVSPQTVNRVRLASALTNGFIKQMASGKLQTLKFAAGQTPPRTGTGAPPSSTTQATIGGQPSSYGGVADTLKRSGAPSAGQQTTILGNGQTTRVVPFAERTGARTLENGLTAEEWNQLSPRQQWKVNDGCLRQRINEGDLFRDIGPDGRVRALDLREAELYRLQERGIPVEEVSLEEVQRVLGGR